MSNFDCHCLRDYEIFFSSKRGSISMWDTHSNSLRNIDMTVTVKDSNMNLKFTILNAGN